MPVHADAWAGSACRRTTVPTHNRAEIRGARFLRTFCRGARVSAARSRSRGLEATSWAPEATWRTRSARFRGASRPPATVHVASTRPVATADEPVCNGPTSLMAIRTAWLCRHMFRHLLQVNACAACAHRLEWPAGMCLGALRCQTRRRLPLPKLIPMQRTTPLVQQTTSQTEVSWLDAR